MQRRAGVRGAGRIRCRAWKQRETPDGIAAAAVEEWFADNVDGVVLPLSFEMIAGGRSNLTYSVTDAEGSRWALRRPPLGKTLGSAHDMGREARVVGALADTPVPVPSVAGFCEDDSVNEAPFYVMDFLPRPDPARPGARPTPTRPEQRRLIGENVVDTLVAIHDVDPDEVGLGELGKKADYVARTLHRWSGQWEKSKTRELPLVTEVHDRLAARIPEQGPATIVHGDYRLDNMILTEDASGVAGVVDWELCTLGDPLADVGLLLVYWAEEGDEMIPLMEPATMAAGFPTRERGQAALRRALRPRPEPDRLLHRARLLEAGDRARGSLRPLHGRRLRLRRSRGRGREDVLGHRRPPRRGRRRGRAPARLIRARRRRAPASSAATSI